MTLEERRIIETGIRNASTKTAIARILGKDKSTYDAAKADHEYRTMLQDARTGVNLTTTEAMQVFSQGTAVSGLPEFNGPFIQTFKFIGLGLLFAIYHDTNRNTVVSMLVSSVFGANLKVTPRPH